MIYKYVLPEQLEGKDMPLKGHVSVLIPSYKEQIALVKNMRYVLIDGKMIARSEEEMLEAMLEATEARVKEVCIERKDNGFKFESFEMLGMDLNGKAIIQEIAKIIAQGIELGKS